jgi:hypothetical protein
MLFMRHRCFAACTLLALLFAAALVIPISVQVPATIEAADGNTRLFFQLDDTTVFSDRQCVRASWHVEGIQAVWFEDRATTGEGSGQACNERAALRVRFLDGSEKTYRIHKEVFLDKLPFRLGLLACGALILAAILLAPGFAALRRFGQNRHLRRFTASLPGPFETTAAPTDRLTLWALVGLILVAAAVRTAYLTAPIRSDEAFTYLLFASQPLTTALSDYSAPNNHLLHTLLVHLSTSLWGYLPWAVRLPAFMAGILVVPAVYQVGRRFYGRWVGLFAAGLLVGSSYVIEWSTVARGYPQMTLFFLLLLITANELRQRPTRRRWALFALWSVLGLYSVPTMIYPLALTGTWLLLALARQTDAVQRRQALRGFVLAAAAIGIGTLLLYLPALLYVVRRAAESPDLNILKPVTWHSFIGGLLHETRLVWAYWNRDLPGWLTGFLIAGLGASLIFHPKLARYPLHWAIAAVLSLTPLLFIPLVSSFARLWIYLLPLYFVLCAAGGLYLVRIIFRGRALWREGVLIAAFGVALFGASAALTGQSIIFSNEGTRSLGAEEGILAIRARQQNHQPVVCVGICLAHEYYGLIHDVPLAAPPQQPTDTPYFVIVYLDKDQHEIEPALERIGYDQAAIGSIERIYESVDSAVYFITPADAP